MELKSFAAASAVINDTSPSDRGLYSSQKIESIVHHESYNVEHPKILIRKGKNAVFNISSRITTQYLCIDMCTLLPSTKYMMWFKPSEDVTIARYDWFGWKTTYRGTDCFVGTVTTEGQWIQFETSSTFIPLALDRTMLLNIHKAINVENICIVKADDWTEDLEPYTDNTGYMYTLPFLMSAHDGYKDTLVQRDGDWYKITTNDDVITDEEKLDGVSCAILTTVANLNKNNSGYEVSLIDDNHNVLSDLRYLTCENIDYVKTEDYRFVHKNREFIMHSIGIPHAGCTDYGSSSTLETSLFSPFVLFDAISLGCNTVQLSMSNSLFMDGSTIKDQSTWDVFVQFMNFATMLGVRVILKFYTFAWGNATTTEQSMILEKYMVDLFKNNPIVIGYSVANEPGNCGYRETDATIVARYEAFIHEIQMYIYNNTKQIMFVERMNGVDTTLPNVSYEEHIYAPHAFTHNDKTSYPNERAVMVGGVGSREYTMNVAIPSEYPRTKDVSDSNEFAWQSTGLFKRIVNQDEDGCVFSTQVRIDNTAKVGETFDIKEYSMIFYDADQNVVGQYTETMSEDTDLSKYNLLGWTTGSSTTLNNDDYLSLVQENDEYILQLSVPEENYRYIQITKGDNSAFRDDAWVGAFGDGNTEYIELRMLTRAKSTISGSTSQMRLLGMASCSYRFVHTLTREGMKNYIKDCIRDVRNNTKLPIWVGECGTKQSTLKERASGNYKGGFEWITDVFDEYNKLGVSYNYFLQFGAAFGMYNTTGLSAMFDKSTGQIDEAETHNTIQAVNMDKYIPFKGYSFKPTKYDYRPVISNGVYDAIAEETDALHTEISEKKVEPYLGKKVVHMGDSWVELYNIADLSAQKLGYTVINMGFQATAITDVTKYTVNRSGADKFALVKLAQAIQSNDWTEQDDVVSTYGYTAWGTKIATLKALDWSTVDVLILSYGINDYGYQTIPGDIDARDSESVCGALKTAISILQGLNTNMEIVITTPCIRYQSPNSEQLQQLTGWMYSQGDYRNAIGLTAKEYGIKLVDMRAISGINESNQSITLLSDGLHPTVLGQQMWANAFAKSLECGYAGAFDTNIYNIKMDADNLCEDSEKYTYHQKWNASYVSEKVKYLCTRANQQYKSMVLGQKHFDTLPTGSVLKFEGIGKKIGDTNQRVDIYVYDSTRETKLLEKTSSAIKYTTETAFTYSWTTTEDYTDCWVVFSVKQMSTWANGKALVRDCKCTVTLPNT